MNQKNYTPTAADYDEEYYKSCCGCDDYVNSEPMKRMFRTVAKMLRDSLQVNTVLDAGCACGHLVAAFREIGVEAWGVDISEYAISQVTEECKPYCAVASLTESLPAHFPRRYDLVLNIEILEHMTPEDGSRALYNLCRYSDTVLFSSTPDDTVEKTHVNVQPLSYWIAKFHQQGFYVDFRNTGRVLNPQSMFFSRNFDHRSELYAAADRYYEEARKNAALAGQVRALQAELRNLSAEK